MGKLIELLKPKCMPIAIYHTDSKPEYAGDPAEGGCFIPSILLPALDGKTVAAKKEQIDLHELDVIIASEAMQVPAAYSLENYVVTTGNAMDIVAHVKLRKDGALLDGLSLGDGPIDAAFLVLDPRQEGDYWLGFDWTMRTADIRHAFPMHSWEDFGIVKQLKRADCSAPYRDRAEEIYYNGQVFEI